MCGWCWWTTRADSELRSFSTKSFAISNYWCSSLCWASDIAGGGGGGGGVGVSADDAAHNWFPLNDEDDDKSDDDDAEDDDNDETNYVAS